MPFGLEVTSHETDDHRSGRPRSRGGRARLARGLDGTVQRAESDLTDLAPDPNAPARAHARYFLDVAAAREALATVGPRVRWSAAMWGLPDERHVTTRRILAGGPSALAGLHVARARPTNLRSCDPERAVHATSPPSLDSGWSA